MKNCSYCGASHENNAEFCSACGANEFKFSCDNCGTMLKDGLYCPKCGVKFGKKAKFCVECGEKYYSNACPNCGYTNARKPPGPITESVVSNQPVQTVYIPPKPVDEPKKVTFWTIICWLFFFPIMVTIAVWRSKKLNVLAKTVITAILWIIFIYISQSGSA